MAVHCTPGASPAPQSQKHSPNFSVTCILRECFVTIRKQTSICQEYKRGLNKKLNKWFPIRLLLDGDALCGRDGTCRGTTRTRLCLPGTRKCHTGSTSGTQTSSRSLRRCKRYPANTTPRQGWRLVPTAQTLSPRYKKSHNAYR